MTRLSYAIVTTVAVSLLGIASVASFAPKLIWNASASTPVGFYTIEEPGPVAVTDLVAVDAPEPLATFLSDGGYLPRGVPLLISSVRERLPNGRNLREFLELAGLSPDGEKVILMPTLEAAIEWVEDRLLGDVAKVDDSLPPLQLHEIALFNGSKPDTLTDLAGCMEMRACKAGETIYARGDGDKPVEAALSTATKAPATTACGWPIKKSCALRSSPSSCSSRCSWFRGSRRPTVSHSPLLSRAPPSARSRTSAAMRRATAAST